MIDVVQQLIESIGYFGIALFVFVENIFPPIPSEAVIPFAGFAAKRGELTLIGVIVAGTAGTVLGALPLYYLGYRWGEERVMQLADEYGQWFTVSGEDIERADQWLRERGEIAVFLCRMVPGLRSIISIPAGIAGMNKATFLGWTTLGSLLWTALLAIIGYILGQSYDAIEPYLNTFGWIAFIALAGAFAYWVYQRRQDADTPDGVNQTE